MSGVRGVPFASWRVAVRIARRDAWRNKGRSLMVLAMIALPIMGVSAADITIRSSQLTQQQKITRDMGAADARLRSSGMGRQPVFQSPDDDQVAPVHEDSDAAAIQDDTDSVDPRTAIPAGARWITDARAYAQIHTRSGLLETEIREFKADDPLAEGVVDLDRGRFPAAPDEMIATQAFLKSSGLHVGSRVTAYGFGRGYRIVGAYDLPSSLSTEQLTALPGSFIAAYDTARRAAGADVASMDAPDYLVELPGDFTWSQVEHANTLGVTVSSRAVLLHPPADAQVPLFSVHGGREQSAQDGAQRAIAVAAAATIAGLAMLEICLLAGPAFAVGARRSRRQLGLVGANGGDRRHIRAIVLSGGLVIGAVAAVVGTALGIGLTALLRGPLEGYVGTRFGGLALRPAELLGIGGLAVLTGLLAAIVPAITASRQSVLASLTGRRGVRHANRVLPVVGLGAICLGGGVAVFGSMRTDNNLVVAGGSAVAELGMVALTPTLVGMSGRLGRWLPLGPRLALRDAVRNRGRTAPAVAAVLAAVAGTVAVATYAASSDRQDRDGYQARAPRGVFVVSSGTNQGRDLPAVRAAVEKELPVSGRADVSRLAVGSRICDLFSSQKDCGSITVLMPKANQCPMDGPDGPEALSVGQRRALSTDWRCARNGGQLVIDSEGGLLVGGPAVLHALGVRDGAAERALLRGETVLFDRADLDGGRLKLEIDADMSAAVPRNADGSSTGGPTGTVKSLPAHLSGTQQPYGVVAVIPQRTAEAAGMRTVPLGSLFTTSRMPNDSERQALSSDMAKLGTNADSYLERGYEPQGRLVLLALTIFAGLVTVGAAGIATGLAQTDAEPDLRTLAAIGAAPRVRRTLSGFQCGVVAAMGVVLGTAAGVLPAVGLRRAERRHEWTFYHQMIDQGWGDVRDVPHVPIVFPWTTMVLLVVAVPAGATLLAALVTRSRTELARRAEG
ncbi:ABC transporter permease [Streptomyces sp. V4-01]|uniref:ABC transporter permease n=1 Tax=Actinacidiphila polyblastidii TaxID=3110430 RepID=A0ABU7PHP0_9ACTN|nr:ABC transporter permease [Streptomyces sp. V4-01]